MRLVPLLSVIALMAAPALADSPSIKPDKKAEMDALKGQEQGIYRFGATYSVLPGDTATTCQASCADDGACFAWSYVAAVEGGASRCELKRGGGRIRHDYLAISGISPRHEARFNPEPKPELEGGPGSE